MLLAVMPMVLRKVEGKVVEVEEVRVAPAVTTWAVV